MKCYRYKQDGVTYDVFATNKNKARCYLQAITNYHVPTFISVITNHVENIDRAIAVTVPEDYLTPKQGMLKLIHEEYKAGYIDLETFENDTRMVKETWK